MDHCHNEQTPDRVQVITEFVEGFLIRNKEEILQGMPTFAGQSVKDIYLSGIASGMINALLSLEPVYGVDKSRPGHPSNN